MTVSEQPEGGWGGSRLRADHPPEVGPFYSPITRNMHKSGRYARPTNWVSLCQLLGLSAEDVYRLYDKKLTINHRRQDEKRSQAEHGQHEQENRSVV